MESFRGSKEHFLQMRSQQTAGAVLGTSTTTTFVESASGVSEGGRTGLTSVTTAILFGLSLFLSPIFLAIPSFATAPALIIVGLYMLTNVMNIDFSDMSEAIPCYICIIAMPFFYSISEGISMGIIAYVALNLITGKVKEKKVSVLMYVLAVLFILKYISCKRSGKKKIKKRMYPRNGGDTSSLSFIPRNFHPYAAGSPDCHGLQYRSSGCRGQYKDS